MNLTPDLWHLMALTGLAAILVFVLSKSGALTGVIDSVTSAFAGLLKGASGEGR